MTDYKTRTDILYCYYLYYNNQIITGYKNVISIYKYENIINIVQISIYFIRIWQLFCVILLLNYQANLLECNYEEYHRLLKH